MTDVESAQVVNVLIAAYAVPAWSDDTAEVFKEFLLDLPHAETQLAVRNVIALEQTRPTIARIREEVARVVAEAEGQSYPDPQRAWRFVQQMMARSNLSVKNPIIRDVIETMGWRNLCMSTQPDRSRDEFMRLYREAIKNDVRKRVLAANESSTLRVDDNNEKEEPTCQISK